MLKEQFIDSLTKEIILITVTLKIPIKESIINKNVVAIIMF